MPKRYTVEELKIMFEGNPNWKDAPFEETRILPPEKTEYVGINVGPPPKTMEYMLSKEVQEMLARLTQESPKQPSPAIAVNFNETEINGPEDMLMEIVRLKGILNDILAAWNKSPTMPPDLTEKELLGFIWWIKFYREEEKNRNQYPPNSLSNNKSKSQNQIDNENWVKKIYG